MSLFRLLAGLGMLALLISPADAATQHRHRHHARVSTADYRARKPVPHRYHAALHRPGHVETTGS